MSKKLNLPIALGIFLIGLSFLSSVAKAQVVNGRTNAYWDVNGTTTGEGGLGATTSTTWSSSSVYWTTNAVNAQSATGGPIGGGLFSVTTGAPGTATAANSGGYYFNFTGTPGIVVMGGSMIVSGLNFAADGYTLTTTSGNRTITGTNAIVGSVTNQALISLANNVNLTLASANADPATASLTISSNNIVGGTGSSITLGTGAASVTNSVFGGSVTIDASAPIRVNIGTGSKFLFGSQSSGGLTVNANITNNSASGVALDITNSSSGTVALNGVVSGANGLVLNNSFSGKILLSASNTYSGGTTLNNSGSGLITISNAAAFGSGTITSAGAITNYIRAEASGFNITNNVQINSGSTLRLNANNSGWNITSSGEIAGAGSMMFSNSGVNYFLTGTNNSFGGGVSVGNGTLYFNKLGSAGQNSSLGTNGTITVGGPSATTTGGLRWTGTNNETSDKTIVLAGTTGGLSLGAQSSTNASLTLNGNINSTGAGSKTLTFAGYTNNILTLNGLINETGGVNSVVIGASSSGTVVLGNANNSFSGAVTITNDTGSQSTVLSVANIGNSNANSALGQNGTINFSGKQASSLTTLKYTGTGETSDKVINLASTVSGAILDQSGATGNLKFTEAITATGVGAKSITLKGATAATGELAGNISDANANVISLVKNERGTWILSGSNSYSGTTTVEAKDGAGSFLKLMATNALSTKTSLLGANSYSNVGTINFGVAGDYTANSFGISGTGGNNMAFTNSSGGAVSLTFTNANNYFTTGTAGGKTLTNSSANLNIIFKGLDIGSSEANDVTFTGAGNFRVDGALTSTGAGVRGLTKTGAGTLTLAGAGNNYLGTTAVDLGTLLLTNSATLTGSTALTVSTAGTVSSASSTRTVAATLNVATNSSLLSGSTTTVYSGGNLIMNGTAGSVVVESNGLLGGSGTNNGVVTLMSGSLLNPGNSPGTLTAASSIWKSGSTYNWEINDADGTAGTDWDLFSVTTTLDLSDLSSNAKMNLVLASLSTVTNFSATTADSWVFAQAGSLVGAGGVVGAAFSAGANVTDLFNITATAFNGGVGPANGWRVEVGDTGKTLNLMAVPEPSTGSMLGLGLAGLVVTRLLRRKIS